MSRKFVYLLIALTLLVFLSGCKKNNPEPNSASSSTTPANSTAKPGSSTVERTAADFKGMKYNAVAGDEVKMPVDIPVYPEAELVGKRVTNKLNIFDYKTKASVKDITSFYANEMKKQSWNVVDQQANSTDGQLFRKENRTVKIVTARDAKEQLSQIHMFVADAIQTAAAPEDPNNPNNVYLGNAREAIKLPKTLPADIPIYENMQKKRSEHPQMWYEFRSKDTVQTLSTWYDNKLKTDGWTVELDTSELGDTYRIYNKPDGQGNIRKIGIRVNDMKEQQERWLTIVVLPDNITVPQVRPLSAVAAEQPNVSKAAQEEVKRALAEKAKAKK